MRPMNHAIDGLTVVGTEPQLVDAEQYCCLIKNAQDDFFAEVGREHGDAEFELTFGDGRAQSSVLGALALGDIEIGKNFDARYHGGTHRHT